MIFHNSYNSIIPDNNYHIKGVELSPGVYLISLSGKPGMLHKKIAVTE